MDRLEQSLFDGLRRKQPAADFTARVLGRVQTRKSPKIWKWWPPAPARAWVAAAVLLAIALGAGTIFERYRQERRAGEEARRQVVVALQIASAKLQLAETTVQHLSEK